MPAVGPHRIECQSPDLGPQDITARCRNCASNLGLFGTDICDSPLAAFQSAVSAVTTVAKLRRFATGAEGLIGSAAELTLFMPDRLSALVCSQPIGAISKREQVSASGKGEDAVK